MHPLDYASAAALALAVKECSTPDEITKRYFELLPQFVAAYRALKPLGAAVTDHRP